MKHPCLVQSPAFRRPLQRESEKNGLPLSCSESSLQASSQREKNGLPLSCSESSLQASSQREKEIGNERWMSQVIAASKQCGRARLMRILLAASLEEALAMVPADAARYAFLEDFEPGEEPAPIRLGGGAVGAVGRGYLRRDWPGGELHLRRNGTPAQCRLHSLFARPQDSALRNRCAGGGGIASVPGGGIGKGGGAGNSKL